MTDVRPSALPKLAECPRFMSDGTSSEAAARGTRMDTAFREILAGRASEAVEAADEVEAVKWATNYVRLISAGDALLVNEDDCEITVDLEDVTFTGTADAIIPDHQKVIDLKSGIVRNYREQLAAYSLGLMELFFCDEWSALILYADRQEVVSYQFSYKEARSIVEAVVARAHDEKSEAVPCQYCTWCARANSCEARLRVAESALYAKDFEAIIADPQKLSEFLSGCKVVKELEATARKEAIRQIEKGGEVPGWKLITRKGLDKVPPLEVGHYISEMGFGRVLEAYGPMTLRKFRGLWEHTFIDRPLPENISQPSSPITYLAQARRPAGQSKPQLIKKNA